MADSKISALSDGGALQTTDQLVIARGGANNSILAGKHVPGFELDYVEKTTPLTVTATSEGTAQTWIDGNAVTCDGSTRIKIEAWSNSVEALSGDAVAVLVDGSTAIGWLAEINASSGVQINVPFYGVRYLTPSAASHTYHVKWWKTAGTVAVTADVGGAGKDMPSWYRITVA